LNRSIDEVLALLADHGARLHALLTRLTLREDVAEDLLQELFLKLTQRPGFGRAQDPVAYAFRAAINLAFDWRRARKKVPRMEPASDDLVGRGGSPPREAARREELQRVLDALVRLPGLNREIVVMRYLEQHSYETIAGQFGKTPHQVRALCHKALSRLRSLLDKGSTLHCESGRPQDER
jgi:RNA polymerase sigma-70 factor (ECF subfamily)